MAPRFGKLNLAPRGVGTLRAAGHVSLSPDRASKASEPKAKSPLSQLLDQKPFGFRPSTPKSLAASETVASLSQDTRLQEMSTFVSSRGGSALPALGPRTEEDFNISTSPTSCLRAAPSDTLSPLADVTGGAFHAGRTGRMRLTGASGGFGRTRSNHMDGEGGDMQQTGWSVRQSPSWQPRGTDPNSLRRSRATFEPERTSMAGSKYGGGTYEETLSPSASPERPRRPSTREAIAGLRSDGLCSADAQVRKLASRPSPAACVEELYRHRGADEDTAPLLQRQTHSMPDLHSNAYSTEACQRYNDDTERWLRRLLVDVNISHKSLPSGAAQRQICSHMDKVHSWFDRSRSTGRDLTESAGARKAPSAKPPMQAGIYLSSGEPPLPGSVKWQSPERKKTSRTSRTSRKALDRSQALADQANEAASAAVLDDGLSACETADEAGELVDALST